jgi:hypothetical protein
LPDLLRILAEVDQENFEALTAVVLVDLLDGR